ncbi:hypothetical protein ACFL0Q_07155 [Thermodesulfobacteriota bacterium]
MFGFLVRYALHTGHYGTGRVGLPDLGTLKSTIFSISPKLALLCLFVFLSVMVVHKLKRTEEAKAKQITNDLLISFAAMTLQLLLYLKSPGPELMRYLVPIYPSVTLAVICVGHFGKTLYSSSRKMVFFRFYLGILALFSISTTLMDSQNFLLYNDFRIRNNMRLQDSIDPNALLINVDFCYLREYSLYFGVVCSQRSHREALKRKFPHYYNLYTKLDLLDGIDSKAVSKSEMKQILSDSQRAYLVSVSSTALSEFALEAVEKTDIASLYRIRDYSPNL